ncbi:MAG: PIG-L deacetylase family protein [Thermoproteota archaeon]
MSQDFIYYDLVERKRSDKIELIFKNWKGDAERLVIISPHDDDAILDAMYLSLGAMAERASIHVIILCDGRGGYNTPEEKESIVSRRRVESLNAYTKLGIEQFRVDYPDFSLSSYVDWILPGGFKGAFPKVVERSRKIRATRLLVPNEYCEHPDHEAASRVRMYDGPQAGDPVMANLGEPICIESYVKYSVWSDFSPLDSLISGRSTRADFIVKVCESVEKKIREALREFSSQKRIIDGLIESRKGRSYRGSYIEPYLRFDPRPPISYNAYKRKIEEIEYSSMEVI